MGMNDAWLDQVTESALEPELPICDPHHHLWDHRPGGVAPRYLLDDYLADIAGGPGSGRAGAAGHNVVSSVFIECGTMFRNQGDPAMRPVGETEFANGQAAMAASGQYGSVRVAAGIVGTAYLSAGESVADVLDRQIAAAPDRFRGIRQAASRDADPQVPNHRTEPVEGLYLNATFRRGFAELAPRGLSYEAWCYHTQIGELADLARAFPDTTIVLDHFGGPLGIGRWANREAEVFESWKRSVDELAECPNVHAKLGGLAMAVNGFGWHDAERPPDSETLLAANRHYYEYTIERFGVPRCMFESNFPVDRESCSFTVLWNMFKRLTTNCSADEKRALFHDNAARLYRIE